MLRPISRLNLLKLNRVRKNQCHHVAEGPFQVLQQIFDEAQTRVFKSSFDKLVKEKKGEQLRESFGPLVAAFAIGAAKAAGGVVLAGLTS